MPLKQKVCSHITKLKKLHLSEVDYCEECVKTGSTWFHLRICQVCGKVHCCDSSPNRHASKHFEQTGHEVVIPVEKNAGSWAYCYAHKSMADISNLK